MFEQRSEVVLIPSHCAFTDFISSTLLLPPSYPYHHSTCYPHPTHFFSTTDASGSALISVAFRLVIDAVVSHRTATLFKRCKDTRRRRSRSQVEVNFERELPERNVDQQSNYQRESFPSQCTRNAPPPPPPHFPHRHIDQTLGLERVDAE